MPQRGLRESVGEIKAGRLQQGCRREMEKGRRERMPLRGLLGLRPTRELDNRDKGAHDYFV